jgi:aspartyl-tRNA(Asn)/glutamyl-tRNA(Gln) amidotransferase subunit C
MAITREEVLKTARLAHLHLSEHEVRMFTGQLSEIIDYVDQLKELDVSGVPPMSHSTLGEHVERTWREDAARPGLGAEAAVANGPETFRGFFKVPSVIVRPRDESEV